MKNSRKISNKLFITACCIVAVLVGSVFFTSCSKGNSKKDVTTKHDYSGEELFQGIIFASGPVANQIQQLKDIYSISKRVKGIDMKKKLAGERRLIDMINKQYPGYTESFKKEILSKDYVRIQTAISEAREKVMKVAVIMKLIPESDNKEQRIKLQNIINTRGPEIANLMTDIRKGIVNIDELKARIKAIFGDTIGGEALLASAKTTAVQTEDTIVDNIVVMIDLLNHINLVVNVNVEVPLDIVVCYVINIESGIDGQGNSTLKQESLIAAIANKI